MAWGTSASSVVVVEVRKQRSVGGGTRRVRRGRIAEAATLDIVNINNVDLEGACNSVAPQTLRNATAKQETRETSNRLGFYFDNPVKHNPDSFEFKHSVAHKGSAEW